MVEQDDFQLDKQRLRASFEQAANGYDEVAVLQREVGDRLLERLDYVRLQPERVLDIGAGTGYCSRALARRYRKGRVIALDLAHGMTRRARAGFSGWTRRFGGHGFVCGDAESLPLADASCELIFSNLTLQWCNNLDRTFSEFRRVLRPGGLLMFSTFGPQTLTELRQSWAAADDGVHVNGFIDMHDVGDAMVRAGFEGNVLDSEHITLTYREVPGLLRDLKALGAHNVNAGRPRSLTGKGRIKAMQAAYEAFRSEGVLPATYEVVYGHGWVAAAGLSRQTGPDGAVPVSLEQLRDSLPEKTG